MEILDKDHEQLITNNHTPNHSKLNSLPLPAQLIIPPLAIDWNKDYYAVLEVPRFSSLADIKTSYRSLAKKYHPDMNPGNKAMEDKFKEINSAYDLLSDEQNKQIYDHKLKNPFTYQQQQFKQEQRSQFDQYQRAKYEAYLKQQQRAEAYQRSRQAENKKPNYDINPWRIIFIVLIIINLLRMCTHSGIIP